MDTLDQSWRGFKCALKKKHYYKYDNLEDRLNDVPERVPEEHYKTLLAYWETTAAKVLDDYDFALLSCSLFVFSFVKLGVILGCCLDIFFDFLSIFFHVWYVWYPAGYNRNNAT